MLDPTFSGKDATEVQLGDPVSFIGVPYRNMDSGLQMTPLIWMSTNYPRITASPRLMGDSSQKLGN